MYQDLRFAQHHRVQPAGYAESVAGGVLGVVDVEVGLKMFDRQAPVIGNPRQRGLHVLCIAVDFRAVAGRKDGCLADGTRAQHSAQRVLELLGRKGELLTQAEGGSLMVEAESDERHVTRNRQ